MNRIGEKNSRGRHWTRDEEILALDVYFATRQPGGQNSREVEELCEFLNKPFNAVWIRFANYNYLNPEYSGKGLSGGKTPKIQKVWDEFVDDRDRLRATANAIREHIEAERNTKSARSQEQEWMSDDPKLDAIEGNLLAKSHIVRERNRKLVQKKKKSVLQKTGRLVCEACGFDFAEKYGKRGEGVIECHHTKPLRDLKPRSTTRLSDLVLLCSNCHSMIHAKQPWLEVKEIVRLIKLAKRGGRARKNAPKRRKG